MSVHYKFKSALESDTVTFDGLHISVRDLKNSIMQQKRIGRNNDFDLQVTNAETKEVYDSEETLIPKNTALLIARIPSLQTKPKVWEGYGDSSSPISKVDDLGPIGKAMDLASLDASEEDKIKAMMSQSTLDYDPSNYMKIRGANQVGTVPPNYRCYKCHQGGHWIKDCTLNQTTEPIEIKKSTGIPRSFMIAVEGPQVQGAMITPNGLFAVPALDHQAYTEKPHPAPPLDEVKPEIPEDLVCSICSDLLTDAVMIPCCGDSYCDECIRSCLLESEEHECPACHEKDISPGTLIPNRYLRNSVTNFKSTTGYIKRPVYKPPSTPIIQTTESNVIEAESTDKQTNEDTNSNSTAEVVANAETKENNASSVITEESQSNLDSTAEIPKEVKKTENEQPISSVTENSHRKLSRDERNVHTIVTSSGNSRRLMMGLNSNERSPRRRYHKSSPTYHHRNDRGGTPTIDEPGIPPSASLDHMSVYQQPGPAPIYANAAPPPAMGIIGMPPPIQVPPGNFGPVSAYPPPNPGMMQPNFRMPPPGAPPFAPGAYTPRPAYDMGRVPSYPPAPPYQSSSRGSKSRDYHRDYRRGRSPPNNIIVDDPLEAFNRMLREKDERERRAKQRKGRSYSRSSSRSVSPSPPRKIRSSRSPPRRRSRSRSFSISRSRSRSFSPGARVSPSARHFSPKRPFRKMHGRYSSPGRSPQRFRARDDDRDHRQERDNFGYRDDREREFRDREPRVRDFKYYDNYDRNNRGKGRGQWNGPRNPPEQFYQAPNMAVQQPYIPTNRYPPHEVYPPHHIQQQPHQPPSQVQLIAPPVRKYEDDVVPPGTEQPPVPGLENAPSIEERYQYTAPIKEAEPFKQNEGAIPNPDFQQNRDQHKHEVGGGTPERKYYSPPPRKQERDHEYQTAPEKHHKRRRHDDAADKKRDASDDERSSRKNKDKKRKKEKREKKEEERRKRRERREKREQDKLNKKAAEEKERLERKHKREIIKQDAETQASNDEDEENIEMDNYDDSNTKYYTHDELEEEQEELDDNRHFKQTSQDSEQIEHEQTEQEQEAEDIINSNHDESPKTEEPHSPKIQHVDLDLYEDALPEEIDTNIIENYVKKIDIVDKETKVDKSPVLQVCQVIDDDRDEGEITDDDEESEKDVLELHTNEAELKIEAKNDVLAPLPEKSKWEVDEDLSVISTSSIGQLRGDPKFDRNDKLAKVTNEVLKRAENAIFAKAINAIRPIEIKKISVDRAKLYTGDRDKDKSGDELREEARNIHITITSGSNYENNIVKVEPEKSPPKVRLSVKERLGCKVDDLDRIVKIDRPYDRNRSHSLSPLSRRSDLMSRNLGLGERRYDLDNRNRSNHRLNFRERNNERLFRNDNRRDKSNRNKSDRKDRDRRKKDDKKSAIKSTGNTDRKPTARRKSPSGDEKDKHKKKDKHDKKKEKIKHHKKDGVETESIKQTLVKTSKNEDDKGLKLAVPTDKRKPTLDEASFEPDYDLESESDKEDTGKKEKTDKTKHSEVKPVELDPSKKRPKVDVKKRNSSSSGSSESSSDDERKRQKHRKHKKRRDKRDSSSSSSSESESESSDDDRDKRRKRHKKKSKKRKKSKHK